MHPTIDKALKHLQNANYAGYFEEMDKIVPSSLKNPYAEHKGIFISGQTPWNFYQKLEVFTKQVDGEIGKRTELSPPQQEIDDFRALLFKKLERGFEATPDVFIEIEKCSFEYNKSTLADLKSQAASTLTQLSPSGFLVGLKSFILTIN